MDAHVLRTRMRSILALVMALIVLTSLQSLPTLAQAQTTLIQPQDFVYLGAFRLPEGGMRPDTFEYGGNAMTFYPAGDPNSADDGFSGSLFVTGHDRMPYGELPDGSRVAEVTIPAPVQASSPEALQRAAYLQPLSDAAAGFFAGLDEIPRIGLQYLNTPATGPLLHIAWGQHFQPDAPAAPSHAWFSLDLAQPNMHGSWFVSPQTPYSVNGYLFDIPADWADTYVGGRYLATGRYRDGGWSGMGPALFAYRPWIDAQGTPAPDGAVLDAVMLLHYSDSGTTNDITGNMSGYQHADEWEGGAWLTTAEGHAAVLFVGTKGVGEKYWYGWVNPQGAQSPCVETEMLGSFTLCRLADGTPCPQEDLLGCSGHTDYRGWWSSRFAARFILYNPDDLARVAQGELAPDEPQPYAYLDVDEHLFLNADTVEPDMLGTGDQRRGRIGDAAYDREHQLLYVLELFADGAQPVVHVWRVQ